MAAIVRTNLMLSVVVLLAGCADPGTATSGRLPSPSPGASVAPSLPACNLVTIPSETAPADQLITPAAIADVITVTSADVGSTVFLRPQQHLLVEVGFPGSASATRAPGGAGVFWTTPQAPDPGPLYRENSSTCPSGSALSMFTAVGTGGTTVSATTDAPCFHTEPKCRIAQLGFEIYVVVRDGV